MEGKTGLYFDKNVKQAPIPNAATDEYNRRTIWEYVNTVF
jgi:hypothetical protein